MAGINKWYNYNFSNEQVVQGKKTMFLRFKNIINELNGSLNSQGLSDMWIIPIIEFIEGREQGKVFFNGLDVYDIEEKFKLQNNYQDHGFMIYGGPVDSFEAWREK